MLPRAPASAHPALWTAAAARLGHAGWRVALAGAVLATAGDLGQLWTGNALRPELGLPAPPPGLIVPATLAGAVGIPLYAAGYAARAWHRRAAAPARALAVAVAGAAFAALGGTVHAVTGLFIQLDAGRSTAGLDPLQGILAAGPIVVSLWALAAAVFLVAAAAELSLPQAWPARLANPLVLTLAIAGAAPLTGTPWQDFVAPASVNLAHLVFFLRPELRR